MGVTCYTTLVLRRLVNPRADYECRGGSVAVGSLGQVLLSDQRHQEPEMQGEDGGTELGCSGLWPSSNPALFRMLHTRHGAMLVASRFQII